MALEELDAVFSGAPKAFEGTKQIEHTRIAKEKR